MQVVSLRWGLSRCKISGSESFTRWLVGCKGFSLHAVIVWILFLCSRIISEQGARAVLTIFSFPTAFQCKKFEQAPLWHVVLRCPHPWKYNPTASAFTEQQKAFVGPHLSKILGQKLPINHQGDSNEPPMNVKICYIVFEISTIM